MELLNKLTIKNLKLNKKRTIVTIIGILLSVALIMAVATMFFSAHASLIQYEIGYKGNYHYGFLDLTEEEVEELRQNRRIESLYQTTGIGYAEYEGIQNEYKPYIYVQGYDENAMEMLGIWLIEGRLPENEGEILISQHLISNGKVDVKVGDKLSLDVGKRVTDGSELNQDNPYTEESKEEIIDSQTREYIVVGMIKRLPYEMEPYTAPGYTAITALGEADGRTDVYVRYDKKGLRDHQTLTASILEVEESAFIAYNSWAIQMKMTDEELDQMFAEMEKQRFNWQENGYLITLETGFIGDSAMSALATAVVVVIFIIIFTSVYCIKNSFDISITEKIRQYGMLSSIGATKRQIRKNVYYEALILGGIGIPLGLLSGLLAAYILVHVSNYFLMGVFADEMKLIFAFSWEAILFSVLLGLVTVLLSARRSAQKASKISPIQAIRNSGEIQIKASKIKAPKLIRLLFGVGGEISYKNLKRSKKKYRTTVVSIILCVSVFIALTSFVNLAFDMVKTEYKSTDYNIWLNYSYEEEYEDLVEEIRELPDVEKFSSMISGGMELSDSRYSEKYLEYYDREDRNYADYLDIYVLDEMSYRAYVESLGLRYEEAKEQGVLLNTFFLYEYDEEKQSTVEIQIPKYTYKAGDVLAGAANYWDEEHSSDVEIVIAAVTEERPLGISAYHGNSVLILGEAHRAAFQMEYFTEDIYLYSGNASKTQEEIERLLGTRSANLYNLEDSVRQMRSLYTLISIFMYGFIIVIALIGVTNIFNTITTNMNLRRREFAMLKSMGMTRKEFHRMIRLESFFYGMKSLLIGIPAGCILSYLLHQLLMTGDIELMYYTPVNAISISIAAVFLLITVIMQYSIAKIEKQNIIETIRNENI